MAKIYDGVGGTSNYKQQFGEQLIETVRKGKEIWPQNRPAVEGYFDLLKASVEAEGIDINYKTKTSAEKTALMIAVRRGDTETVRYLLSKGADPNIHRPTSDFYSGSPLVESLICSIRSRNYLAISEEFNKISKLLIAGGADVDIELKMRDVNMTPLSGVVYLGGPYHSNEQIKILVEGGADLDRQDNDGNTALMQAARDCLDYGVTKPDQEAEVALKTLIDLGANPNISNQDGQTALMILLNHPSCFYLSPIVKAHVSAAAQYLIEAGANVHLKDQDGNNALLYAGRAKLFDVAMMILRDNYFEDKDYQDFLEPRALLIFN